MATRSAFQAARAESSTGMDRLLQRRATEAVIWGMPLVRFDVMRQAFFRDAQASYGDISYWSKPPDWKLQLVTPNTQSCYVYFNFNTKDGPVVVDVPSSDGTALAGSFVNAWETPLAEVGPGGVDKGRGGRFLLLPPKYKGIVPAGYLPVRSETYNGRALFCGTPTSPAADTESTVVRKIRIYPLAQEFEPPVQRFIDMSGKLFDAVVRFDDSFFDSLARMVGEEPVQTRDLVAMSQICSLGIDKNKAFEPDRATREILRQTASEVRAGLLTTATAGERLWPTTHWIRSAVACSQTALTYETASRFGIDEGNVRFFNAFDTPRQRRTPPPYLCAFCDAAGDPLRGGTNYRLRIPAWAPARSWEIVAYDFETACFIRESPRLAINSHNPAMERNPDGSVDVYFGPVAPPAKERNWIYTGSERPWFTLFRLFEPQRAFFEGTWVLPNLKRLD